MYCRLEICWMSQMFSPQKITVTMWGDGGVNYLDYIIISQCIYMYVIISF